MTEPSISHCEKCEGKKRCCNCPARQDKSPKAKKACSTGNCPPCKVTDNA